MRTTQLIQWTFLAILAIPLGAILHAADDKPAGPIQWTATDLRGAAVAVPADGRPTVLVFARVGQPQSDEALAHVKAAVAKSDAQVIVIFSGETAEAQGKTYLAKGDSAWPVVADPEFAVSGQMSVHVWPTTLIVASSGSQTAHLAGTPPTFPADLGTYLEFAGGRLDEATLRKRLTTRETVTDRDDQKAARRLLVARRLLDTGDVTAACAEVEAGLKLHPESIDLQLAMARIHVLQKQPADALDLLGRISAEAAPAWETSLLKAWALVGLERWDDAKAVIPDAIRVNPAPAEAFYLAGLIHAHAQDAVRASDYFRQAYESTPEGKKLLGARGK